jgi:hypothetical protein
MKTGSEMFPSGSGEHEQGVTKAVDARGLLLTCPLRRTSHIHTMSSNLLDERSLRYVAAPMVNQSDLPFRAMVHHHGCTAMWTQMFTPTMLADQDFRALHLQDMKLGHQAGIGPTVAQIAGNDIDSLVKTARELVPWVDGIGTRSLLFGVMSYLMGPTRQISILDVRKIMQRKGITVHIYCLPRIGLCLSK